MGGELFKLGRLPRGEYLALESELRSYLDDKLGEHYRIPRYYGDKPDFGDVDIVVSRAAVETNWDDLVAEIMVDLGVTDHRRNPAVFSTVWRDFQVDYFVRDEAYFASTYNFLCFNDLGNILGRIYRRLNLKYGEQGLEYVFRRRDDGSYKRVLSVSTDMERILGLIGLDIEPWDAGFETLDDMFGWVTSSPWFEAGPYLDGSSPLAKRATTRPTMQRFLVWLGEHRIAPSAISLDDRDDALPRIDEAFPEARLLDGIADERRLEERAELVRTKFSGKVVMRPFPDLEGKELGEFIRTFKARFHDFEAEVAEMSAAAIEEALVEHRAAFDEG